MELTLPERLILIGLLPNKGHYADLTEIIRAKNYLNPSGDELETLKIQIDPKTGQIMGWDEGKVAGYLADIPFGEWMMNTIRKILRDMDQDGELTDREMTLFEKFVIDYQQL